jgi:hypothetical protein
MKKPWRLGLVAILSWGCAVGALKAWERSSGPLEYMSVPPAALAQALSAGYSNMAADALYLQFVNYFGKHLDRDRIYHNVEPVLMLAAHLDPHFTGIYEMGALALGDSKQWNQLKALWDQGLRANPTDWRFAFDAAMSLFVFGNKPEHYMTAAHYFKRASELPGAPLIAHYMEGRMYDVSGRKNLSIRLWINTYQHASSPEERTVAVRWLKYLGVDAVKLRS